MLGALGFTAFLWFADESNAAWHTIMVTNWLTVSTTILGEVMKQAVGFQVGIVTAMLAAIVLEKGQTLLRHAAPMSIIRGGTGAGNVFELTEMQFKAARFVKGGNILIVSLALLEAMVLAFSQVITIVLASDIGLHPLAGKGVHSNISYGFTFGTGPDTMLSRRDNGTNSSPWTKRAAFYPTFAEYSEPPMIAEGVDDTGLTLRAFLPYMASDDRQTTQKYEGKTTVLDARVTCQLPYLERERLTETDLGNPLVVTGAVRASRYTPRLGNTTISLGSNDEDRGCQPTYNVSIGFSCIAPTEPVGNNSSDHQWRMTMCQLEENSNGQPSVAGGLISEFKRGLDIPDRSALEGCLAGSNLSAAYGTAYLMLNLTKGDQDRWSQETESGGKAPEQYSTRGEWLDLILGGGDLVLSMTLCYSSFDTADIPVTINSGKNRTETAPAYNFKTSSYNWLDLRQQFGQYRSSQDVSTRRLLSLEKSASWISPPTYREPYLRDYANLAGPLGNGSAGNWTAILWSVDTTDIQATTNADTASYRWLTPDMLQIGLFQEILQTGGSVAFALQSLITLFSSMTYYEQLPRFNASDVAVRSTFVRANTPLHYKGFIAVAVILMIHLGLVFLIATVFLVGTKFSMLNNRWSAFAQARTALVDQYTDKACLKRDKVVEKEMSRAEMNTLVGVGKVDQTDKVGIIRRTAIRSPI